MIPTNWHLFSGYHGTVEPPQGAHRLRVGGWTTNHWCERLLGLCGNFVQTLWHRRSHQIQLDLQQCLGYPLVNVYITMENHHVINGKTHYFDWAIFNSYVKLPGSVTIDFRVTKKVTISYELTRSSDYKFWLDFLFVKSSVWALFLHYWHLNMSERHWWFFCW